jgi:D-sedoheptulose 7-phosphate isomerase
MTDVLTNGGTIFWAGNGGSAADCQHLAAELVGRFEKDRQPLKSIALTTDTSILTAIGNDFGFNQIFARQIRALVKSSDLIVFISTSGKSKNILEGILVAKEIGCKTAIFTGKNNVDVTFQVNITQERTCHIQEGHIVVGQLLCSIIEGNLKFK